MTSAPAIGFEYRPSRRVSHLLIAVGCLASVAVALSGMPHSLQAVWLVLVILACRSAVRRLRVPVNAVGWSAQAGWSLRGLDGGDDPAILLSHRVMRSMVLLRLASQRYGKLTLWLLPDNSDPDIRRRLRMRLAVQHMLQT